ncbi:SDR family oxidoreductase [Streptomyces sp. NPDC050636]|uniref:SDR family oxidoreductase n=1 Tax=Streptomyces sp. NPDC050636 TaxID=3154510 RepID=UPI003430D6D0
MAQHSVDSRAGADTQVIVVGAGPVGLMLAGELRLGGAEVTVLEQRPAATTESRASTLHARTMEILDGRGLLDELGTVPSEPRGHIGGMPLDLTLPGPYPGQWKVPQTRTEEILQEWALSLGAGICRGREVTGLREGEDRVELDVADSGGPSRMTARYVVGCDGEDSTVRRLAGIGFPGRPAERELLRADVSGIDIPGRRFERLERGLAIAARRPDGVTRVMVHEFGRAAQQRDGEPDFDEVARVWRRVTGEDISGGTPHWVNAFGDANRQAAHYRTGRVLLAGDAAHQQMPVGGQALNLGLQDAVNLGWKLALEAGGRAGDGLLDSYHTERHAVGRRTLTNIQAQATLLLGGGEVDALRTVIGELVTKERVRAHLAGMISGLDTRYDVGDDTHPLHGARLPHTELTTQDGTHTTAAALLRTGRGLLLDLDGDDEGSGDEGDVRPGSAAEPWSDRVTVVRARLRTDGTGHPLAGTGTVLVRPDGHIVRAGHGADGLRTALRRWFGPPLSTPTTPPTATAATTAATPAVKSAATTAATTAATIAKTLAGNGRDDMGRLTGRTALVTGSSRGMGRAAALRLAMDGALVAVHYTSNKEAADDVVGAIEKDGGRAFAVRAELGVPGDVHELFLGLEEGLKERTGSTDLNILVNNAGVMGGVAPEEITPEQFDRLMAVNAKAPFFIIQRALKNMPDGGRIINISSGLTRFANPEETAYAMTKGAVEQLALHFAKHLGPRNITINSVAPGITRNSNPVFDIPEVVEQMAQLSTFGRVGNPEDVADVIGFLASDDARWVTGSFVDASGGTLLG